LKQGG